MRQYYSQEGSQSLPESARQTDRLSVFGGTRQQGQVLALEQCGIMVRIQKNSPGKSVFSSFTSVCPMRRLPLAAHP